jgi:hypothetical protein
MTTNTTIFPSTDNDDSSSLFSIEIDNTSSSSHASTTPHKGSPVGTHCLPSPTSEALEPILSPSLAVAQLGLVWFG